MAAKLRRRLGVASMVFLLAGVIPSTAAADCDPSVLVEVDGLDVTIRGSELGHVLSHCGPDVPYRLIEEKCRDLNSDDGPELCPL